MQHYDVQSVDSTAVQVGRHGRFVVELGDDPVELPHDSCVCDLAKKMYRFLNPLTPRRTFDYVMARDFTLDATGGTFPLPSSRKRRLDQMNFTPTMSVEERTHFVASIDAHELPPNILQLYAHRPISEVPSKTHLSFASEDDARLAVAVDRAHKRGTMKTVLDYLYKIRGWGITSHDVGGEPIEDALCVTRIEPYDESLAVVPTSLAMKLMEVVPLASPHLAEATSVWVTCQTMGFYVKIVHFHWRRRGSVLVHKITNASVRLVVSPCSGCTFEFTMDAETEPPWWVHTCSRRIASALQATVFLDMLPLQCRDDVALEPYPKPKEGFDAPCNEVLKAWKKSASAMGVTSPTILRLLVVDRAFDLMTTEDSRFFAKRWRAKNDVKQHLFPLLKERFGTSYANGTVDRVSDDEHFATFSVEDHVGTVVAVFVVVLYACVLEDGRQSCALLVDSFAVSMKAQGKGVGGVVYHELCRGIAAKHSPHHHVVFAQCVRKGDGNNFWWDKLDSSGTARSLMYQAFALDWRKVPVQRPAECTPKSRLYA